MLDGEATEEQLMAEMEQSEAYLRRFTGLRLQVGKLLLKPVDEQSVDGDTGKVDPRKDLPSEKLQKSSEETEKHSQGVQKDKSMTNLTGEHVFLQVLRVVLRGTSRTKTVRAFVDTGSTKSNILKSVVSNLNSQPERAQRITLFIRRLRKRWDALCISVNPKDRHIQHNRVVSGVNCSPFLLGATVEHHLLECLKRSTINGCAYSRETIERLARSLYVDNSVASVPDKECARESVEAMAEAQMELGEWEFSGKCRGKESVAVLGLGWFPVKDVFTLNPDLIKTEIEDVVVTKRKLLSMAQKVLTP
ncbi:hypothetical protein JTB14_016362 [Gonioctena quinquepunctata]|nr:hypothetical protein JTB14_016362 [Gonioctena quinquepunctata]